jgi:hypothetical protein
MASLVIVALFLGGAFVPAEAPAELQANYALQSVSDVESPAHASSASAQATAVLFLAGAGNSASSHATSSQRKAPVLSTGIALPAAAAVMREELSFRCQLIAARCGRAAALSTTIPPPLT